MFYLIYCPLYLLSLLPLRALYLLSDLAYVVLYYVIRYRRKIVLNNLTIAFPDKSYTEKVRLSKKFYRHFADTFAETIKMISIGPKELARRGHCDVDYINKLISEGRNVHVMLGHQFNWEFANLMYARLLNIPFIGVYMPISNKVFNRIFIQSRSRYGSILVSAHSFKSTMHRFFKQQYVLALAADQNPGNPKKAFWLTFLGKPVPFVTGPGKAAVKNSTAVVFLFFRRVKRGYYSFQAIPLAENAADYTAEELTLLYKNKLEESIKNDPSNYLWSHRRWRHEWNDSYPPVIAE